MNRIARLQPAVRLSRGRRLNLPRQSRRNADTSFLLANSRTDYYEALARREKRRAIILSFALIDLLIAGALLWFCHK